LLRNKGVEGSNVVAAAAPEVLEQALILTNAA